MPPVSVSTLSKACLVQARTMFSSETCLFRSPARCPTSTGAPGSTCGGVGWGGGFGGRPLPSMTGPPSSNGTRITYHLRTGSCCCCKIRSCVFVECSCLVQIPISHFPHAVYMVSVFFLGRLCFPISNPGFVLFSTSALHSSYPSTLIHPTPLPHSKEKNISLLNIGSPKGRSDDGRHQQPTRRSAVPHEGAQCRHLRYTPPRALHTLHLQVANAGIAR